ncbi:unnamed protein product [Acanthoscelides obtectus]|uniref:HAT C-terminal dimerisation domain-containing protein n=1 Tax=Acanthoscelides obtectus TaxID=200917 RepID=A0A9P0MDW5_ACAOB|nr:unnamed protein product [Acanthoscelides obtectus]CAK1661209.1 hypothetical protein AOBTE_LOCUS22513 [Acanthoscelides obtectus]
MTAQQQIDSCEGICQIGRNINNIRVTMEFVWNTAGNESISALLWWKTFYQTTDFGKVAIRILSMPSTSVFVERSFSTFSFLHDKKRHKLNTKRARKLCYISHIGKVIHRRKAPGINKSTKIRTGDNTASTSQPQQAKNTESQSSSRTLENTLV